MDCNFPLRLSTGQDVPCGKCIACRIAKVRDWSVRLLDESSCWDNSSFITLTYSDDNVPLTNCGKVTLIKSDLQKFFKRLRKRLDYPIKYYACGEYGEITYRPHYHAIVFGLSPEDVEKVRFSWTLGYVRCDSVNIERIRYVCGYVQKKLFYNPLDNLLKGYGCLVPPFQLISQGLGLRHFDSHYEQYWYSLRKTVHGVAHSFPRYYLKKHEEFKKRLEPRSLEIASRVIEKRLDAIADGYDLEASAIQRDHDLKAKIKIKRGVL